MTYVVMFDRDRSQLLSKNSAESIGQIDADRTEPTIADKSLTTAIGETDKENI
jgi:hypothetical protein